MCFMQKNNSHVKFPLSSEFLNVRMVNLECLSLDLVNFMTDSDITLAVCLVLCWPVLLM